MDVTRLATVSDYWEALMFLDNIAKQTTVPAQWNRSRRLRYWFSTCESVHRIASIETGANASLGLLGVLSTALYVHPQCAQHLTPLTRPSAFPMISSLLFN
jgi:hypothetical protein